MARSPRRNPDIPPFYNADGSISAEHLRLAREAFARIARSPRYDGLFRGAKARRKRAAR